MVMDSIKIGVYKEMDGYNFSIGPSIRDLIRKTFPNAFPANNVFVGYDTKSGFEKNFENIESYVYKALLGIRSDSDFEKIDSIEFVDSVTGKTMLKLNPSRHDKQV
jgi:hypothetical protein